jgi:hypothetical protein
VETQRVTPRSRKVRARPLPRSDRPAQKNRRSRFGASLAPLRSRRRRPRSGGPISRLLVRSTVSICSFRNRTKVRIHCSGGGAGNRSRASRVASRRRMSRIVARVIGLPRRLATNATHDCETCHTTRSVHRGSGGACQRPGARWRCRGGACCLRCDRTTARFGCGGRARCRSCSVEATRLLSPVIGSNRR